MPRDGELVKMENGRWARFKRCEVPEGSSRADILVAVELDEHYQELLQAAEDSLESYRRQGIPVTVEIEPRGKLRLCVPTH